VVERLNYDDHGRCGEVRFGYGLHMGLLVAGGWGLLGGVVAALVGFGADIRSARYQWPWHEDKQGPWPRLCVYGIGIVVGMVAAGAAHVQMIGPWPALLMGVGAPSVVKGVISRIEVGEIQSAPAVQAHLPDGERSGSS
jgi:hypothetical protein